MRNILLLSTAIATAAVVSAATPAFAGVADNTGLAVGTYYGTGNANSGWTSDTEANGTGTIELGLQTVIRFVGAVTPTFGATYNVSTGNAQPPVTGPLWDYAYSYNNTGPTTGVTTTLSVLDVLTGQTTSIDPSNSALGNNTIATGFQNAESLAFPIGLDPTYNSSLNDTYVITLTATGPGGTLASVTETVNAGTGVPEPASLALFGTGLLGLRLIRRKAR